jgi:maltose alpha-D-glucosyltransferase/alpha-amylase
MRVVIDCVMNHTSDAHPWFQASRADPDGPFGDFYVWSDTPDRYPQARIIFVDTETSNWTFDEVRGQYFWHRFFRHQPDLNYENPVVQEAMLDVARFWLSLGVDGFRLDAVPYLFEADGTNGENLPATHAFLARLRRTVDSEFPGRILLAEANQWPRDVVAYFGTDEEPECHLCFHFPVMPRIFSALRTQSATAIIDILADTPAIPARTGQWSTFLRNHDELTLEMVTDCERAAMYDWYAPDPRMRANIGIRRRLAPLLDNSIDEIRLANALLLSLPGSPCLYYGDEIGMGDNIWLPDRDGVRTPMQWTPDRNAGFSTADPGRLNLPIVQSLVYHHGAVNVESQRCRPSSLLHWMRAMLAVRREHPAFGTGSFEHRPAGDAAILAFTRTSPTETLFVAANLSGSAKSAGIDLTGYAGWTPVDVIGGSPFPAVDADGSLTLSWGARGCYWFRLAPPTQAASLSGSSIR